MCREVIHPYVLGREHARESRHIALVVGDGTVADDDTGDVEVEWGVLGGVLGCQRVEHKLDVERTLVVLLIEVRPESEELCRGDGNLSVLEGQEIHLGRETGGEDHAVALLVEHPYVVDDDAIEESQVHLAHGNLGVEFLGECLGYLRAEKGLYWWQVQQYDEKHVEADDGPEGAVDDMFKSFQNL